MVANAKTFSWQFFILCQGWEPLNSPNLQVSKIQTYPGIFSGRWRYKVQSCERKMLNPLIVISTRSLLATILIVLLENYPIWPNNLMKYLKSYLCNWGYKNLSTLQFAVDEITTKHMETLLRYIEKNDHSRVPLVTTYHPVLKNLDNILRRNLPILYISEKMADLFKDSPTAAFKRLKKIKDIALNESEIRQPITQWWLKTFFNMALWIRVLYMYMCIN